MDISALNMVNHNTKVTPNYDLSGRETSIDLCFNNDGDIFIIGVVDNNYIHWASLTKTYEKEKNEAIFNHIANDPFTIVSTIYNSGVPAYYSMKDYYRAKMLRPAEIDRAWTTPFGHGYGTSQIENNGRYFADDVEVFLNKLHRRCYFREAGGAYEAMLDFWLAKVLEGESDYSHYRRIEPLAHMIEQESYLRVSESERIREKYILLCDKLSAAYNRYMDVERGGMPPR